MATAIFFYLDGQTPNSQHYREVLNALAGALSNGYTYETIQSAIVSARDNHTPLDFRQFSRKVVGNLLDGYRRYYHPQLTVKNQLPTRIHNVDAGTYADSDDGDEDFFVEPRASYTLEDAVEYFYSKNLTKSPEYPEKRVRGILKSLIEKYDIEHVLFMIDNAAAVSPEFKKPFSMPYLDSFYNSAQQNIESAVQNCATTNGGKYVCRKRMLFN